MATIRLLFVEDEADIKDVVSISLGLDPAIELVSFGDGLAAIAALDAGLAGFQHALLNLRLPAMTGIQLHRALRQRPATAQLTSVLITAAIHTLSREDLAQPGIAGAIAKPFDPLTLAATVKALLRDHARGAVPQIVRGTSMI